MRWCLTHVYNGKTCRVLLTPEMIPQAERSEEKKCTAERGGDAPEAVRK